MSYRNPMVIGLLLLPIGDNGLLMIRRADQATYGKLGLPGGFIEVGETWQEAAARELYEEAAITISAASVEHYWTASTPDGVYLCVFGIAPRQSADMLPAFTGNREVLERVVITQPAETAFELHTEAVRRFYTS